MEEVTPHVYSLDVKIDWFPQPFPPNVHLITDGGEGALIDAGFPDDESFNTRIEWLRSVPGLKLKYIVITHHHFDHSSGAAKLRDATGAKIVMHKDEEPILKRSAKEEIPSDVDVPKQDAEKELPEGVKEWIELTAQWRKEAAQTEAVPVYTIFTNEQLAQMVQRRVSTKADLGRIDGVGGARLEKYGDMALAVLNQLWSGIHETDRQPDGADRRPGDQHRREGDIRGHRPHRPLQTA